MVKKTSDEDDVACYAALGRFIESCSRVEACLHLRIREILGVEEFKARLLIREPRFVDLKKLLEEVCDLCEIPKELSDFYKDGLTHAAYANRVRGVVAHTPLFIEGRTMSFSNFITAKTVSRGRDYICTPTQLAALTDFTNEISAKIFFVSHRGAKWHDMIREHKQEEISILIRRLGLPPDPAGFHLGSAESKPKK